MAQRRNNLPISDALRLFAGLAGFHPQSAKELKAGHRAWMKAHHPDITGKRDPLSLESVQWMNAAYDVLKGRDWTKPTPVEATAGATPEWTDVGGSTRAYPDFDDVSRRREEQLRQWRERQEKERREKEEEHRRWGEAIKRRNEALKKRLFWQKILWGNGDSLGGDEGLSNPGFLWCCWNLFILLVGIGFSAGFAMLFGFNMIIAGFYTSLFALPGQATPPECLFNLHDWLMVWATLCLLLLFATSVSGLLWSIQTELRR
jgi:hypothetical protein